MSSSIPSELLTALTQDVIRPYYAVEVLFDDEDGTVWNEAGYAGNRALRLWTGYGNRTIGTNTYIGSGDVLQIEGLEQASDLSAKGATITLNGISDSIMSIALTEWYQGRYARVMLGEQSVSSVSTVFAGLVDTMPISHAAESVRIQGTIESKLITLQKANVKRYTPETHHVNRPNDTFFDWVPSIQDKEILWGRTTAD